MSHFQLSPDTVPSMWIGPLSKNEVIGELAALKYSNASNWIIRFIQPDLSVMNAQDWLDQYAPLHTCDLPPYWTEALEVAPLVNLYMATDYNTPEDKALNRGLTAAVDDIASRFHVPFTLVNDVVWCEAQRLRLNA